MSVKNLYPKFNQCSKITPSVMGIINDVLNNPVKISNCIDNNHSFNKKHISPYKKTNHIAEYTHVNEIDLETSPLGSVIHWMEGLKTGTLHISDYTNMRVATKDNDWQLVYDQMEKYKNTMCIHHFCLKFA